MHPILFRIGSFQLPTYGVLLALALLTAIYVVMRLGRREGFDSGQLLDFSTWLIIAALLGAKVLLILTQWGYYSQHPGDIFSLAILESGGVFYGGFIAATVFAVWYIRVYKLPLRKMFDVYAPAIAIGQCVGRLGCFSAGCDFGKPTHSFLAVVFTSPIAHANTGVPLGIPIYPWQLFESAALLVIFAVLIWRYRHKKRDGEIFLLYLVMYAVERFFLEFLRGDQIRGFVFNHLLSTSQFIALLALGLAAILAYKWYGPGAAKPVATAGQLPSSRLGSEARASSNKSAREERNQRPAASASAAALKEKL